MASITSDRRRQLAAEHNINEAYLYQCLTGRRDMEPGRAMSLEIETAGELRRWTLCNRTWHRIWPDLIGQDGAPEIKAVEEQGG